MRFTIWRRAATGAVLAILGLAVGGCLLTPGNFTSALDLRRDGRFSFSYSGEIRMLALTELAERGNAEDEAEFTPSPCQDDAMKERPCSAAELSGQEAEWQERRKAAATRTAKEREQLKTLLGGIDPASPEAAEELGARLRRQAGWKSVVYKGNGLFVVDYAISGRLDHDFAFPSIERFPLASAFVQLTRRADGSVRIDAPAYGPGPGAGTPFAALMATAASGGESSTKQFTGPALDGTFALTTDGPVLANNTDDGPRPDPAGQRLEWKVNARTPAPPTALVRLGN